jgi:homoserine kinase
VSVITRVAAFAPSSIGNLGPGLDILGCAVAGPGDTVQAEWSDAAGITLLDPGGPELPNDPSRHTSAIAAREVWRRAIARGLRPAGAGIAIRVTKGLPLSAGQGGSAASAVAGAVAANALIGATLPPVELLDACLVAESAVAGRHLDNLAPSLLGGIVLIRAMDPIDIVPLAVPNGLFIVLAYPDQRLRTAEARAVLPAQIDRATALHQAAQVAAIVAALASGNLALLGRAIDDRIAEPVRAPLIPGFRQAKAAALDAGALGASISGAGPTTFALASSADTAERVAAAMRDGFAAAGVSSTVRVTTVDRRGAYIQ